MVPVHYWKTVEIPSIIMRVAVKQGMMLWPLLHAIKISCISSTDADVSCPGHDDVATHHAHAHAHANFIMAQQMEESRGMMIL